MVCRTGSAPGQLNLISASFPGAEPSCKRTSRSKQAMSLAKSVEAAAKPETFKLFGSYTYNHQNGLGWPTSVAKPVFDGANGTLTRTGTIPSFRLTTKSLRDDFSKIRAAPDPTATRPLSSAPLTIYLLAEDVTSRTTTAC
jgi:hypothetical protein